jgi:ferredoxin-NADP reductase
MSTSAVPKPGRMRDRAVALARAISTPLLPQDYLDLLAPLHSADLRGRVEAVLPETHDSATLIIRPGRGWRGHEPGQYLRVGVDVDGVRLWRAYSLTSPPGRDRIAITVKAMPDGVVSNYLVRRLKPGTLLQLDQACGDFTLPPAPPHKVLFITAGSGVTPVMGMLRSRLDVLTDVVHVHAAPSRADAIFGPELRQIAQQGRLSLRENHDDTHGYLSPERLRELVGDLRERETWACGPVGLLDMLEQLYAAEGVPDRLHTERFRATFVVTGDGGTVTFSRQSTTVEAAAATPILDAGEAAGVLMPSGCRMGVCFGCVVPLTEGAVRNLRTGELTTAAPGDNVHIQTCINAAAGPCSIDL